MSGVCTSWALRYGPEEHSTRAVLLVIADAANAHGENARPGLERMMRGSNYGRSSVLAAVRKLVDEGWVEVVEKNAPGRAMSFRLPLSQQVQQVQSLDLNRSKNRSNRSKTRGQQVQSVDLSPLVSKERLKNKSSLALVTAHVQTQDVVQFDSFWATYPRRCGKGAARKAWAKAITKAPATFILLAAERYRDDPNRDPDPKFVPHPATWLNQERWDDDPAESRPSSGPSFDEFGNPV